VPLTIEAGADFPRMLAELAMGRRVAPAIGRFRENVWMTSYETAAFLDERQIKLEPHPALTPIEEIA
jgi:hypothetical protein